MAGRNPVRRWVLAGRSEGLALEPLWHAPEGPVDAVDVRGGDLPPELAARYQGELSIPLRQDRPTIIANFVSTLDGAVSLGPGEPSSGGGEISGFSDADRFMMALLRSMADVVIVGAGTVRTGRRHIWTADHLQPGLAGAFAAWRSELWLAPQPTTVIVTATGNLDGTHAGLNAPGVPVVVVTTKTGAERMSMNLFSSNVQVRVVADGPKVPIGDLLEVITSLGARVALCEGGPHLFTHLVRARLVDDLFLTIAPQVVGRDANAKRLALVEGAALNEGRGRWASLIDVRHAGDDMFLRYRFAP
jgi:riboflavin biosynthesis pyrimidine reductase